MEHAVGAATAVLCVLSLPARVLAYNLDMRPHAINDSEKYAVRAAVQVGRGVVTRVCWDGASVPPLC